ncbi:hypothetical protein HMPREF3226_02215 [Prevotella corporis]|uniref:Uncharacterized protein n=1 Tax=Prevotella corporis TaxID=28128 RepID=A0A133PXK3_9BACT|nr:hypothetical protein HMPREF3226_02215 [Prevotella corporis]
MYKDTIIMPNDVWQKDCFFTFWQNMFVISRFGSISADRA